MAKKKRLKFWPVYLLYVLVIIIIMAVVAFKVRAILVEYEGNVPENYVLSLAENVSDKDSDLGAYLEKNCYRNVCESAKYGDSNQRYENMCSRSKGTLEVRKSSTGKDSAHPVYNVTSDGKPFLTVGLEELSQTTKLGILTMSEWKVDYCIVRSESSESANITVNEKGTLDVVVKVPDGHVLYINGTKADLSSAEKSSIEDFEYVQDFVQVPQLNTLNMNDICFEPELTAENNAGEAVEITKTSSGVYEVPVKFASTKEAEELYASTGIDALEMGKTWSKFMTNDTGATWHGLYLVRDTCRLLPDTDLYEKATKWARSIDITFVSHHTINSWTNGGTSNCIKYNDSLFSVDVYIEKNMTLSTGAKRTDVLNQRFFFVYNTDTERAEEGWYLADMMTLSEE